MTAPFDYLASTDPEAAALRDAFIAPLIEQVEIAAAFDQVEIEHARSLHPSSFGEYAQIGEDMDAIARGMGNLRTIDDLSPGDLVKIGDEWCVYEFVRGDVLTVTVEGSCAFSEYPLSDGELFVWQPGQGGF